jgi:ABC-type cobalamin/Fe3+-siderophores transport system ATPase subunit
MHKAPNELVNIKNDLMTFLKDREAVATIRNEKELSSIAGIHELNEQARVSNAMALNNDGMLEAPDDSKKLEVASDEEAGALRSKEEAEA